MPDKTRIEEANEHMLNIPHSSALGMEFVSQGVDECELLIRYSDHLVGDPDRGVIHGGAITALPENAAGVVARPPGMAREQAGISTFDLRIAYMVPAQPGLDVHARAHCFKRTSNIAFVRAIAFVTSPDDPIATCTATFMLGTRATPFIEKPTEST